MKPYEAVVLRYRHDLVGGEFVNFGLAYADGGGVKTLFVESFNRLTSFFPDASESQVRRVAMSIKAGLHEIYNEGDGLAAALKEILADPSSSVVTSESMTGVTPASYDMCASLFERHCSQTPIQSPGKKHDT